MLRQYRYGRRCAMIAAFASFFFHYAMMPPLRLPLQDFAYADAAFDAAAALDIARSAACCAICC